MTTEEIATLLRLPVPTLLELGKDPMSLISILNLAVNSGIHIGQEQTNNAYHTMFTGYNPVTLVN